VPVQIALLKESVTKRSANFQANALTDGLFKKKKKAQSSTACISSVGYYSVMMFSRQRGGRRCPDGTEQQFIFQVLVPKSILMIVNLICANLQFYFFSNIFSATVVKVIAKKRNRSSLKLQFFKRILCCTESSYDSHVRIMAALCEEACHAELLPSAAGRSCGIGSTRAAT
jgi:hypothetical protein